MIDLHSQAILNEYKDNLDNYEKLKEVAISKLNDLVSSLGLVVNCVDGRVKTEKSLTGKLALKGFKYKSIFDITDIVGVRIVTFYTDEVDKVAASIGKCFDVDWDNCIDKRKLKNLDQFGYMSVHYICKIPKEVFYDESMPMLNEIRFELQIKSTLQHAWATIQHDIGYKKDIEVPTEYLRGLNRLAGLLELADEEFKRIRSSLDDYRKKIKAIVESGNFGDAELNVDTFNAYIESGIIDSLNNKIADINKMDIIEVPLTRFLQVFKMLDFETLGNIEEMRKKYEDYAYQFSVLQFQGMDIDIITSSVGLTSLCTVYIIDNGYGEAGLLKLYKIVNGDKKSNERLVKKALLIADKIGINQNGKDS